MLKYAIGLVAVSAVATLCQRIGTEPIIDEFVPILRQVKRSIEHDVECRNQKIEAYYNDNCPISSEDGNVMD